MILMNALLLHQHLSSLVTSQVVFICTGLFEPDNYLRSAVLGRDYKRSETTATDRYSPSPLQSLVITISMPDIAWFQSE